MGLRRLVRSDGSATGTGPTMGPTMGDGVMDLHAGWEGEQVRLTFVCYDTETTGTDVRHDQATQFAAVVADHALAETDAFALRCRRLPYVVPTARALEVSGTHPASLDDPALPTEFEFAREVARRLEAPAAPKVFVTFNGAKFDEELLRTTLHRNLMDPFLTSRSRGRLDLLPVIRLAQWAAPGVIEPAFGADGKETWRLSELVRSNGIEGHLAHDALGDARALVALMRRVAVGAPELWASALALANFTGVEAVIAPRGPERRPFLMFTHYGAAEVKPWVVLSRDPVDKRRFFAVDLSVDPTEMLGWGAAEIAGRIFMGAGSPFRLIRSNGFPIVFPSDAPWLPASAALPEPELVLERLARIMDAAAFRAAAAEALAGLKFEAKPDPTAEERLYAGFASDRQRALMRRFHDAATWGERAALMESGGGFGDATLDELCARLFAIHAPERQPEFGPAWDRTAEAVRRTMMRPHDAEAARWPTIARAAARLGECLDAEFRATMEDWLRVLAETSAPAPPEAAQGRFSI